MRRRTPRSAPDGRHNRPTETTATCGLAAGTLTIRRVRHERGLHLLVSGTLDATTGPHLRQACQSTAPEDAETVLLDLAELTLVDSRGLDALFAARAHFGERLVIIIGPAGAQTIDLANVRSILPIIEG